MKPHSDTGAIVNSGSTRDNSDKIANSRGWWAPSPTYKHSIPFAYVKYIIEPAAAFVRTSKAGGD